MIDFSKPTIWFYKDAENLEKLKSHKSPQTMADYLDMSFNDIGNDYLEYKMPVTDKVRQPYGLLHGGASCALAETVGSIASFLVINPKTHICVGQEINANHLKSVQDGEVFATAKPLHLGKSTHVWDIRLTTADGTLFCISRLTVAVIPHKSPTA